MFTLWITVTYCHKMKQICLWTKHSNDTGIRLFAKNLKVSIFRRGSKVDHLQGQEECLALPGLIIQQNTTFQKTTLLGKIENTLIKISSLISAASPEKMDRNTKLRAASRTMNIHQQGSPLGNPKYREIHCHIGEQKNGVNRVNSVQKATNLKKKSKVGLNEMYCHC